MEEECESPFYHFLHHLAQSNSSTDIWIRRCLALAALAHLVRRLAFVGPVSLVCRLALAVPAALVDPAVLEGFERLQD